MNMKFTIEKSVILEGLSNVTRAISTKNVIPVLNGIKFELTNNGLYLTASDSELTIKVLIESKDIKQVNSLGIIIQSKYILDIVRKMPSDLINFEVIDGLKVKIYTDNNQYNLNCLDINDYPDVKLEENKNPIIINGEVFKTIINQTVFAISNQELRPILTGVNFKFTKDVLETVATDSYRLAKKNITRLVGAREFINGELRWCLWLVGVSPAELRHMPAVMERIEKVKKMRENSPDEGARKLALTPAQFRETNNPPSAIVVPCHSSQDSFEWMSNYHCLSM